MLGFGRGFWLVLRETFNRAKLVVMDSYRVLGVSLRHSSCISSKFCWSAMSCSEKCLVLWRVW